MLFYSQNAMQRAESHTIHNNQLPTSNARCQLSCKNKMLGQAKIRSAKLLKSGACCYIAENIEQSGHIAYRALPGYTWAVKGTTERQKRLPPL